MEKWDLPPQNLTSLPTISILCLKQTPFKNSMWQTSQTLSKPLTSPFLRGALFSTLNTCVDRQTEVAVLTEGLRMPITPVTILTVCTSPWRWEWQGCSTGWWWWPVPTAPPLCSPLPAQPSSQSPQCQENGSPESVLPHPGTAGTLYWCPKSFHPET